jgi:hypothetical protein
MFSNFAFTLYEIFGYLLPGMVVGLAFVVLFWVAFAPTVPLGLANYQPSLATWTAFASGCYLLGHAVQAVANIFLKGAEEAVLIVDGTAPLWLWQRATQVAANLVGIDERDLEPQWVFRILDEYGVQTGKLGDRDMLVYREGFYRGIAIALFFLSVALVIRAVVPGSSVQLTKGVLYISKLEILITALITGGTGRL